MVLYVMCERGTLAMVAVAVYLGPWGTTGLERPTISERCLLPPHLQPFHDSSHRA